MDDNTSHFLSPRGDEKPIVKETTLKSEDVNAAIALADDGNTIILCDYNFVNPPEFIGLDLDSLCIHIVGGDFGMPGVRLQYPVEYGKINIWKSEKMTYFAYVDGDGAHNPYEVPVVFVNEE